MTPMFQIIPLSSLDPEGVDKSGEPQSLYPDALKTAEGFKAQGKAFRVFAEGEYTAEQIRSFFDLGAVGAAP